MSKWTWNLQLFGDSTNRIVSGFSKDDLIKQLSTNNRAILPTRAWTDNDITIKDSYMRLVGNEIYIWLTNDSRRILMRQFHCRL
jgi:hypothetical protein